jgi:hypothetical protein
MRTRRKNKKMNIQHPTSNVDGLVKSPKISILFISPLIIPIGYKDDF